jgi:hypothetical protein
MHKKTTIFLALSFLIVIFLIPIDSGARIYLFDRKLEITGKIEQKTIIKYHMKSWEKGEGEYGYLTRGGRMKNPASFKTHFHIDGLLHLYKSGETLVDIYTLWEWFYDFAPDMRGDIHRAMRAYDRNKYQTPHGEEMCRELYINFVSGPWTLRLGKQMIVWGETSLKRTADVINPLDTRSHMMGVDDWEDFRKGLWMFRGFYETSLRNNFTIEWIWVPHDVEAMDLPTEGGFLNTTYTAGFVSKMWQRWRYDQVDERGLHNSQGGFRLRGYNWDIDWTVLYYNGYDPTPVCSDWGQRGSRSYKPTTPQALSAYRQGNGGFNVFAGAYNMESEDWILRGGSISAFPDRETFKYYRTDNFAATAVKYFHSMDLFGLRIPLQTVARWEFSFKEGVHFNKLLPSGAQASMWPVTGIVQRDIIGYAVELTRDFMPQFICRFNGQRSVDMTLSFYQDWILNHKHYLGVNGLDRGYGDRSSNTIGLSGSTYWMKDELMTMFSYSHNLSGHGDFWVNILYAPGDHWRFTFLGRTTWSNVGPHNHKHSGYTERNDANNYVMFKIGYQF